MRFTTLNEWLSWQEQLHPRAIDMGLQRLREVAQRLQVTSFVCPVITVAGTNGKGSSVALLEALLTAGGYRVGTFSSPHLFRYNERIRIAGRQATDAELIDAFERIDAARGAVSLTFFEFNALAALLLFKMHAPDVVVLEVGLGGRLDAVNLIDADVALLTTVGLDHCDWLGDTVEQIGREKAGIFRPGRPAVLGRAEMPQSVLDAAQAIGARLCIPGRDFDFTVRAQDWDWRGGQVHFEHLPLPALRGVHQPGNAAAVIAALNCLRERLPLTKEHLAQGLRAVRLHGRFETVDTPVSQNSPEGGPQWIFDVAHNPQAALALADNLRAHPHAGRTLAVAGILRDKDIPAILEPLIPLIDAWIAADTDGPRGSDAAELIRRSGTAGSIHWSSASSVEAACELALEFATPQDRIVVFGSFHTVGPALQWLERKR